MRFVLRNHVLEAIVHHREHGMVYLQTEVEIRSSVSITYHFVQAVFADELCPCNDDRAVLQAKAAHVVVSVDS